jgi:hypothetical protein
MFAALTMYLIAIVVCLDLNVPSLQLRTVLIIPIHELLIFDCGGSLRSPDDAISISQREHKDAQWLTTVNFKYQDLKSTSAY